MKTSKRIVSIMLVLALVFSLNGGMVFAEAADDTLTVGVPVEYRQTEARTMLRMVNDFRTGENAWEWNEDNTSKIWHTGLGNLVYDYTFEKVAMQRAAEIALSYSHTRPSQENWYTAYYEQGIYYDNMAENIAVGTGNFNAEAVFEAWQETEDPYEGQGHRRNMLSGDYGAIGIGHVVYNGIHYWVQEFRGMPGNTTAAAANNAKENVPVTILKSTIIASSAFADTSAYQITYGSSAALPTLTTGIRLKGTWNPFSSDPVPVIVPYTWKITNTQIASMSNGKIMANKVGETTLTTSIMLDTPKTVSVPIKVTRIPRTITASANSFTKIYGDKAFPLNAKTNGDGTLSYISSNNSVASVDSTTGTVTVKGAGTATITISAAQTATYTSATKKITVTVKRASQSISGTTSFTKTYGNKAFSLGAKAKTKLSYKSGNESVAVVSSAGKVTIKGAGTATITISAEQTAQYAAATKKVKITVKPAKQSISGKKSFAKTYGNKAFSLGAKAKTKLSYKSGDKKVVTVNSSGKATITGPGKTTVTITAKAGNYAKTTKTVTITVKPKKVTSVKTKAEKKKMTVSWKKDSKATGYELVYAANKKFTKGKKTITITKAETVKKTIKKLKSKKTYYVKVRAYKKVGSAKIYGKYSKVKNVKVK